MRILIIRFSSLGDIVLTQPIVKKLHEVFPDADLYFLTKEQYAEILFSFGIPLNIILFSDLKKCYKELKKLRFDYVFDLQAKMNSFWVKLLCTKKKSFTYSKQRMLRTSIVAHRTDKTINSTLDLYQSALLKAAMYFKKPELTEGIDNPRLFVELKESNHAEPNKCSTPSHKHIAIFPGAKHNTKIYPAVYFTKLIQAAEEKYFFWLLGGREDCELTRLINESAPERTTDYCGKLNLFELLQYIDAADMIISGDSGPMHLAAALAKPQIAIFGSTHPKLGFKPLNDNAAIVCKDIPCQPCSLHGNAACPKKHYSCMLMIEPEEILSLMRSRF